jgi:hypothetical protein
MATDLLGNDLEPYEADLLGCYQAMKGLLARPDLPPVAAANIRAALAQLAQAVNSLGLAHEHLVDIGV